MTFAYLKKDFEIKGKVCKKEGDHVSQIKFLEAFRPYLQFSVFLTVSACYILFSLFNFFLIVV